MNRRRTKFVAEYLIDLNATQAAIRAGYAVRSAKQQGARLLTYDDVAAAIEERQGVVVKKAELDAEWVLTRLCDVADRCMQSVPVFDRSGNRVMIETPNGTLAAAYAFQPIGATKALELLGKHIGMFVERGEININHHYVVEVPSPIPLADQWQQQHGNGNLIEQ